MDLLLVKCGYGEEVIGRATLEITRGDITGLTVDAIVNPANKYLAHGGGVALAIVRKGGFQIQAESTALDCPARTSGHW